MKIIKSDLYVDLGQYCDCRNWLRDISFDKIYVDLPKKSLSLLYEYRIKRDELLPLYAFFDKHGSPRENYLGNTVDIGHDNDIYKLVNVRPVSLTFQGSAYFRLRYDAAVRIRNEKFKFLR